MEIKTPKQILQTSCSSTLVFAKTFWPGWEKSQKENDFPED